MALQLRALVTLTEDLDSISSTPMVAHNCLLKHPLTSMVTVVVHIRVHAKHSRIVKMLKRKGNSNEPIVFRPKSLGLFQLPTQQMVLGMDSGMSQGY